jgi:hypothetical protein
MSPASSGIIIEENRQQKSSLVLRDVRYRLYANLVFIPVEKRAANQAGADMVADENPGKYNACLNVGRQKVNASTNLIGMSGVFVWFQTCQ